MTKDGKTAVIQQNIYNGEGQRIQKVDGDETTNYYYQDGVVAYTTDANGEQNSQNLIGTDGNVLATERFQQNATQYYLYNKDIQESTSSLVKEDGSTALITICHQLAPVARNASNVPSFTSSNASEYDLIKYATL